MRLLPLSQLDELVACLARPAEDSAPLRQSPPQSAQRLPRTGHLCFIAGNRDSVRRPPKEPRAMPISWLDVILDRHHAHLGLPRHGARIYPRGPVDFLLGRGRRRRPLSHAQILRIVLEPYIGNPSIAQIAFAAGVFIVTLIVVSLITFRISDSVLDSRVGALDRTFGFIFGLARGFLLVAIVFILFTRACPRPAGLGAQCALLPHSAADAGRHRIAAAHESGADICPGPRRPGGQPGGSPRDSPEAPAEGRPTGAPPDQPS